MSANAANHRTIDTLRQEIDTLDEELLALIEKRLDLAASIASASSGRSDFAPDASSR